MFKMTRVFFSILLFSFVDGRRSDLQLRRRTQLLSTSTEQSMLTAAKELQSKVKKLEEKYDTPSPAILSELKELQRKINLDYDPKKWGVIPDGSYSFTRLATRLVTSQFDYLIGELPVFVYDAPTHTDDYLGNRLGNYFEAVTCANMAGLHFVCLTNQTDANKLAQGLPTIIVHPNPVKSKTEAFIKINHTCVVEDNKFPWENPASLQYTHPSVIRTTFGAAIDKYIHQNIHDNCKHVVDSKSTRRRLAVSVGDGSNNSSSNNNDNRTNHEVQPTTTIAYTTMPMHAAHCIPYDTFSYVASPGINDVDIEKDNENEKAKLIHRAHAMMPLIPSVTILFRCCDILVMQSDQYGFIKWAEYLSRIPLQNTTSIYILTEGSSYNSCSFFPACKDIQKHLVTFLRKNYPLAIVAIRRGYPNDAMVMLSRAPIVICCSSTFCLYPALSRSSGVSYLQHTTLIAGDRQPVINDHVKWISTDHVSFTHPGGGKGAINNPIFIRKVLDELTSPPSLKPSFNGHSPTIRHLQTSSPTSNHVSPLVVFIQQLTGLMNFQGIT